MASFPRDLVKVRPSSGEVPGLAGGPLRDNETITGVQISTSGRGLTVAAGGMWEAGYDVRGRVRERGDECEICVVVVFAARPQNSFNVNN